MGSGPSLGSIAGVASELLGVKDLFKLFPPVQLMYAVASNQYNHVLSHMK